MAARALPPVQPPLALQEEAFVVDHVSVDEPPDEMLAALAVIDTVGCGAAAAASTATRAEDWAVPPELVQARV